MFKKLITKAVIALAIVLFGHHIAAFYIEHRIASGLIAFAAMVVAPVVKAAFHNSAKDLRVPFTGAVASVLGMISAASDKAIKNMTGAETEVPAEPVVVKAEAEQETAPSEAVTVEAVAVEEAAAVKPTTEDAPVLAESSVESMVDRITAMQKEVMDEVNHQTFDFGDEDDEFTD